jgi:hypothetical protein
MWITEEGKSIYTHIIQNDHFHSHGSQPSEKQNVAQDFFACDTTIANIRYKPRS